MKKSAVACIGLLFSLIPSAIEAKEWTDVTGTRTFQAEFISMSDDLETALMVDMNGREYEIPREALSESDQEYVLNIDRQLQPPPKQKTLTSASIPEDILFKMKQTAHEKYPNSREMQLHYIMTAAKEFLGVKSGTIAKPASNAPNNTKTKKTGFEIPAAVAERVRSRAQTQWPKDGLRQANQVRRQLGYYRVVKNFQTNALPRLAVVQIKHNAKQVAPNDYRAQLRYVFQQVKSGRNYLASRETRVQTPHVTTTTAPTSITFNSSAQTVQGLEPAATDSQQQPTAATTTIEQTVSSFTNTHVASAQGSQADVGAAQARSDYATPTTVHASYNSPSRATRWQSYGYSRSNYRYRSHRSARPARSAFRQYSTWEMTHPW